MVKRRNILYHHGSERRLTTILPPKRLTAPQLWAAVRGNAVMGLEQRGIFTYRKDNIDQQKRTLQNESLVWLESEDIAPGSFRKRPGRS